MALMAISMHPAMLRSRSRDYAEGPGHGVRSETVQMQPAFRPKRLASVRIVPDSISQFMTPAAFMSWVIAFIQDCE